MSEQQQQRELLDAIDELDDYERSKLLAYLVGYAPDEVRAALAKASALAGDSRVR
jgi:hypothetical protein